jgi:hypothetical protein
VATKLNRTQLSRNLLTLSFNVYTLTRFSSAIYTYVCRFLGINKPGKESFVNLKWAIVIVTIIWVSSSAGNVPLAFWSDISTNQANGLRSCVIVGVDPATRTIQLTFARFAFYFVPLVITWICYIGLVIRMRAALTKVLRMFGRVN